MKTKKKKEWIITSKRPRHGRVSRTIICRLVGWKKEGIISQAGFDRAKRPEQAGGGATADPLVQVRGTSRLMQMTKSYAHYLLLTTYIDRMDITQYQYLVSEAMPCLLTQA